MSEVIAQRAMRSLRTALESIEDAIKSSSTVDQSTEVPDAFNVVAKHLPLVKKTLRCIMSHLESQQAEQDSEKNKDFYTEMKQLADDITESADRLSDLFNTVSPEPKDSKPFVERYRKAVGRGSTLEDEMEKLLMSIRKVAKEPIIDESEIKELKGALKDVQQTSASLEEVKSGNNFYNTGPGMLPVHMGRGNINPNLGNGPLIAGDTPNSTWNFGYPSALAPETAKKDTPKE